MDVLFDDVVTVEYGYLWIASGPIDSGAAFTGQTNGLCGASVPHELFLRVGTHTGQVGVRIETLGAAPPLDEVWQDVVEASYEPPSEAMLGAFEEFHDLSPWPPAGSCRVRWSGLGMDEARETATTDRDRAPVDRYLLQLWPDPEARPDAIVRRTSRCAEHWHATPG